MTEDQKLRALFGEMRAIDEDHAANRCGGRSRGSKCRCAAQFRSKKTQYYKLGGLNEYHSELLEGRTSQVKNRAHYLAPVEEQLQRLREEAQKIAARHKDGRCSGDGCDCLARYNAKRKAFSRLSNDGLLTPGDRPRRGRG